MSSARRESRLGSWCWELVIENNGPDDHRDRGTLNHDVAWTLVDYTNEHVSTDGYFRTYFPLRCFYGNNPEIECIGFTIYLDVLGMYQPSNVMKRCYKANLRAIKHSVDWEVADNGDEVFNGNKVLKSHYVRYLGYCQLNYHAIMTEYNSRVEKVLSF